MAQKLIMVALHGFCHLRAPFLATLPPSHGNYTFCQNLHKGKVIHRHDHTRKHPYMVQAIA